uniref:Uncharacterized protein n=1 Tax=Picea glauca TaxID=3330 RepID=A0A101M1Z4_PICGL|nr:hypothetical protein ABT39_MTgene3959 [Picea glauca]QHR91072.1 hypothetical protein Q903MT_gene5104 [Picea sitchensis]
MMISPVLPSHSLALTVVITPCSTRLPIGITICPLTPMHVTSLPVSYPMALFFPMARLSSLHSTPF